MDFAGFCKKKVVQEKSSENALLKLNKEQSGHLGSRMITLSFFVIVVVMIFIFGKDLKNLFFPPPVSQKHIINCKIVDKNTNYPIPNAIISIKNNDIATKSNSNGDFEIELYVVNIDTTVVLNINAEGYKTMPKKLNLLKNNCQKILIEPNIN